MAKIVHDDVLDGALNIIKNNCTRITVCSTQPTTYTEGNTTYALADVTVDSTDFTLANGDTSGRKVTVGAQSGVPVDTTGSAQPDKLHLVGTVTATPVPACVRPLPGGGLEVRFPFGAHAAALLAAVDTHLELAARRPADLTQPYVARPHGGHVR